MPAALSELESWPSSDEMVDDSDDYIQITHVRTLGERQQQVTHTVMLEDVVSQPILRPTNLPYMLYFTTTGYGSQSDGSDNNSGNDDDTTVHVLRQSAAQEVHRLTLTDTHLVLEVRADDDYQGQHHDYVNVCSIEIPEGESIDPQKVQRFNEALLY